MAEHGTSIPKSSFSSTRIAGLESVSMASRFVLVWVCVSRARAIPSSSPSKWVDFVYRYLLPTALVVSPYKFY